jgi:hypothetical protein
MFWSRGRFATWRLDYQPPPMSICIAHIHTLICFGCMHSYARAHILRHTPFPKCRGQWVPTRTLRCVKLFVFIRISMFIIVLIVILARVCVSTPGLMCNRNCAEWENRRCRGASWTCRPRRGCMATRGRPITGASPHNHTDCGLPNHTNSHTKAKTEKRKQPQWNESKNSETKATKQWNESKHSEMKATKQWNESKHSEMKATKQWNKSQHSKTNAITVKQLVRKQWNESNKTVKRKEKRLNDS